MEAKIGYRFIAFPMTQLVLDQIPSNIATVEQLHGWSAYLLAVVNPDIDVLETPQRTERLAQVAIFQAADSTYRLLSRTCLPVDPTYITDRSKKSWMYVNEASNVVVPAGFLSN